MRSRSRSDGVHEVFHFLWQEFRPLFGEIMTIHELHQTSEVLHAGSETSNEDARVFRRVLEIEVRHRQFEYTLFRGR